MTGSASAADAGTGRHPPLQETHTFHRTPCATIPPEGGPPPVQRGGAAMALDAAVLGRVGSDPELWADFNALCDCGGRLSGTDSERHALDWLARRGAEAAGMPADRVPVEYGGWRPRQCRLTLLVAGGEVAAPCHPLVRTKATAAAGVTAEIVDLGRGTAEEFAAHAGEIAGRIVLVRHEYMFAAGHLHRRRKYDWAREHGAVGFMIASPLPGGALVGGSSGREGSDGIPAVGVTLETAARLAAAAQAGARVRLIIATEERPATTETLVFDIAGQT